MAHFQEQLYNQLKIERPEVVVETGVQTGVSTDWILRALVENRRGCLYSIDPSITKIDAVTETLTEEQLGHWYPEAGLSVDVLKRLPLRPAWDVFLHDSDHNVHCQTYELEFAWRMVRPGGLICADDYTWGDHGAWPKFCTRHGATALDTSTLGAMAYFRKPLSTPWTPPTAEDVAEWHQHCLVLARLAAGAPADGVFVGAAQDGVVSVY